MKAVILVGGEGTRLRPLTLSQPKPVVPVVDRPFLQHQIDLLRRAGVEEVVFSVAYQPEKVRAVFGDGRGFGVAIHYAVEETPLGTGGAVKNARALLDDTTVVLNGDVLTDVDVAEVVACHRRDGAAATLVLAPVPNPAAYGLVEFDAERRVTRFLEKPSADQITTDTINAGIYVLATATLELIPPAVKHSIERSFFPALLERGDRVAAHVHRGYWIDIGTPAKYLEVHRDVLRQRFPVALHGSETRGGWLHPEARVDPAAELSGPFYLGPGCEVAAGARVGPDATIGPRVRVAPGAEVQDSVIWEDSSLGAGCAVRGALVGPRVRIEERARLGPGAVIGEASVLSAHSCA